MCMSKFLMREMPNRDVLFEAFGNFYPEVAPHHLYTHMWLRLVGSHLEDAVDDFLAQHKISSGRFLLMLVLEFRPDGVMPSDLAQSLGVTQSTVTGLINGLQDMGLAARKDCASDGRACFISLTEQGREFMLNVRPQFNRWVGGLYEGFSIAEQETLVSLLERFLGQLRSRSGKAPVAAKS